MDFFGKAAKFSQIWFGYDQRNSKIWFLGGCRN